MIQTVKDALAVGCATIALLPAGVNTAAALSFTNCLSSVSTTPGGPPSVTATEASTTQALELIRQRRLQVAQTCPDGFLNVGGICQPLPQPVVQVSQAPAAPAVVAPAAAPAAPAQQAAAAPSSAKSPAVAKAKSPAAPKVIAQPAPPPPSSDYAAAPQSRGGGAPIYGAWAEGLLDFEWHDNIAPGQQANPDRRQRTVGYMSGIDRTTRSGPDGQDGVQVGAFSGYLHTHNKFSDTETQSRVIGDTLVTQTTGVTQTLQGATFGLYGSAFSGPFAADVMFKADVLDFERRGSVVETLFQGSGCGPAGIVLDQETTSLQGSTTLNNYGVGSNLYYKLDMGGGRWWEPTVGVRYTFSDFGSNASALGLKDGHTLRVQGGVRIGSVTPLSDGLLTTSLTGLLYSDVVVDGYISDSTGLPPSVAKVDEGKLRVLGMLQSRYSLPNGMTYYGQAEIRGGEDVIGIGGKVGMRYEW